MSHLKKSLVKSIDGKDLNYRSKIWKNFRTRLLNLIQVILQKMTNTKICISRLVLGKLITTRRKLIMMNLEMPQKKEYFLRDNPNEFGENYIK